MRDALDAAAARRRIEIGVEDAAWAAELELQAAALADLERRRPEPLDQIGRGQADQLAAQLGRWTDCHRLRQGLRLLRSGRAPGNEQAGEDQDTAHGGFVPRPAAPVTPASC